MKSEHNYVRNWQIVDVVFDVEVLHGLVMHATPCCYLWFPLVELRVDLGFPFINLVQLLFKYLFMHLVFILKSLLDLFYLEI